MPEFDPFAGLLDSLSKGGKASYGFLRSLALQEPALSKASILKTLSDANFKIRRETGLDLIDLIRHKADVSTFIKTFGQNAIIPPSVHSKGVTTFRGDKKVSYEVGTNSANPLIPKSIYVSSNAPLSADQIYGAAAGFFTYEKTPEFDMSPGALQEVTFTIDDARYSPGEGGEFSDNTSYGGA